MPISARQALARLAASVDPSWPGAEALGDWSGRGFVGEFGEAKFRIRQRSPVPRYYALQAHGVVTDDGTGAVVVVRVRRRRWASIALWFLRILWIVLLAGAIFSSTQQSAFLPSVFLVAVGGGAFLWLNRARRADREALFSFIQHAFPDGAVLDY